MVCNSHIREKHDDDDDDDDYILSKIGHVCLERKKRKERRKRKTTQAWNILIMISS